jgi:uncharacterized membrane protein YfcA
MTPLEATGLAAAAAIAGAMNAVAGGGTLLTFPALLAAGTPPVVANATSTLALMIGSAGSVAGYRRHIDSVRPWLWRFVPVSFVGGLLGSFLLTRTNNETFAHLVPFLILFATILFMAQGAIRHFAGVEPDGHVEARHHKIGAAIAFQFGVAVYGGYFGAGIGILMLASLGFIGLTDIHRMNALKAILASVINVVASIWFIAAGLIHWPRAGIMTVGAVLGAYLGSHYAQRIPQVWVRRLVTAIGLTLAAVTFYKQFLA